jgi:serine/threonine protein kinase
VKEVFFANLTPKRQEEAYLQTTSLSHLNHMNIVGCYDCFAERNLFHIVMEFADGGGLAGRIESASDTPFPEDQILDWFAKICYAIRNINRLAP